MAVQDYSTTPGANTAVNGIFIGPNCPPGNIDNALRQIMADVKVAFNGIGSTGSDPTSNFITKSGGVFTGNPTFSGRGGYMHNANPACVEGRVHFLPEGSPRPTAAEGVMVFYFS